MKKRTEYSHTLRNLILSLSMLIFALSPLGYSQVVHAQSGGAAAQVAGGILACTGLGSIISIGKQKALDAVGLGSVPVSDSTVQSNTTAQITKECSLDTIAYGAAKLLIQKMTDNIVAYINSGFNGSPAFVTNPSQFFRDIGDEVAGELIYGTELNFLCSPFEDILRANLKIKYRKMSGKIRDKARCTLSGVADNYGDFVNNNFKNGSLNDLITISQEPQNNPLGAWIEVSGELESRLAKSIGAAQSELSFNKGFLNIRDEDGNIVTPGVVIEGQLQKVLGSGITQLELADEFNEIIGALMGQLTNKVFGSGGLFSGSYDSGSSYSTDLYSEATRSITLVSPEKNTAYVPGDRMLISWSANTVNDGVEIFVGNTVTGTEERLFEGNYLPDGTFLKTVVDTQYGTGASWIVPDLTRVFTQNTTYNPSDVSDNFYLIVKMIHNNTNGNGFSATRSQQVLFYVIDDFTSVSVTKPQSGNTLTKGTQNVISWIIGGGVNDGGEFVVELINDSLITYKITEGVFPDSISGISTFWSTDKDVFGTTVPNDTYRLRVCVTKTEKKICDVVQSITVQ